MENAPSIRDLWDFDDIPLSEQRFREWIDRISQTNPYHFELKTQLARTYSLRGRFNEAHEILNEVVHHLDSSALVRVRYLLERGRTYNSAAQAAAALPLFEEAWNTANTANLDALAIDAAHMVAIADPDPEKQVAWNLKALELAEQSRQQDAKHWFGSLYNNLGWTYHDLKNYEQALTTFQKAASWYAQQQGQNHAFHIAQYAIARTLRSLQRHQDALDILQPVLQEQIEQETGDGFIYEELAENWLALGQADKAQPYFEQAYQHLKDISWMDEERLERLRHHAELK